MKLKNLLFLLLGLCLSWSCQEEIAPTAPPISGGGGTTGGGNTGGASGGQNISDKYSSCVSLLDTNTLDVVTWNIENFPMGGATTISLVKEMIENLYPDIIALQEIRNKTDFATLKTQLADIGYDAVLSDVRGSIELAYIYKKSEIVEITGITQLYANNSNAFPRQPVLATIKHKSGLEVKIINIHLKALDSGKDRRIEASRLLKEYVDTNLPSEPVIILGDFNDEIIERVSGQQAAFKNFVDDPSNFEFADYSIDAGSSSNWSYPSFPSHLDHILITNELSARLVTGSTSTVKFRNCESRYNTIVSDHRPVIASFNVK